VGIDQPKTGIEDSNLKQDSLMENSAVLVQVDTLEDESIEKK
jgi:hypothetical protein